MCSCDTSNLPLGAGIAKGEPSLLRLRELLKNRMGGGGNDKPWAVDLSDRSEYN